MSKSIIIAGLLILIAEASTAQKYVMRDGDRLYIRDSVLYVRDSQEVKATLLSSIARGELNQDAFWITYNRRPGVDPWRKDLADLEKNFTQYWNENNVKILGALVTYDNCLCFKTKTGSSPDMFLIHFKVLKDDWTKMKEQYPDMLSEIRKIN